MFEYKIAIDSSGTKHFKDIGSSSDVDYVLVVHNGSNEEKGYVIGFLPRDVLGEVRVGDKFYSLGMGYVVSEVSDYVYVNWVQ